jgi:hypothetical protein
MKRAHQITFVIVFLAIIAVVPVVQTCYEFAANPGHRVQMLDLVEDLFLTPARKAAKDAVIIDSLLQKTGKIGSEISKYAPAAPDSTNAGDRQEQAGLCDDALTEVMLLKKNVVDYNRHLESDANRWAGKDTLKPYYRSLAATGATLDTMIRMLRSSADPGALGPLALRLRREAAALRDISGSSRGLAA